MRASLRGPWALGLALGLLAAEGFVVHLELACLLSAQGRFLGANWTLAFNKMPFVCYSDADREFFPCGLGEFEDWFATSAGVSEKFSALAPGGGWGRAMQDTCRRQMRSLWATTGGRRTPPSVRIFPISPENTPAPIMLTCEVWGFYPADVAVAWLRNGTLVKSSAGIPVVSNGDWTYQTRLRLPVYPQGGDTYTCLVEHAALPEPLATDWEPGLTPELKVKVGVSSAALGVGLLFLIAGIACWCKRAPEGYVPIDGDSYPPVGS